MQKQDLGRREERERERFFFSLQLDTPQKAQIVLCSASLHTTLCAAVAIHASVNSLDDVISCKEMVTSGSETVYFSCPSGAVLHPQGMAVELG